MHPLIKHTPGEVAVICMKAVKPQFRLDLHHGWHGVAHWSRVMLNGLELCDAEGLGPVAQNVVAAFAFLHDSQRFDEGIDREHGPRASKWVDSVQSSLLGELDFSDEVWELLYAAMGGHSEGRQSAPKIVQVCWDADRLDLGRVGIMPDARYLCTDSAKDPARIERCYNRSTMRERHRYEPEPETD